MSLVKWFRKNNTKIMAVVVVGLMIMFVGGTALQQAAQRAGWGPGKAMAHYGNGRKITRTDRAKAQRQLEVLQGLGAAQLLRGLDLRGIALGELLFAEGRTTPALLDNLKRTVRASQYRVSDSQLEGFYRRPYPADIYWILLTYEAKAAGIAIPRQDVAEMFGDLAPQLFGGAGGTAAMQGLVKRYNVSEGHILDTLGELLAVLQYSQATCSTEGLTESELRHAASWETETISAEYVRVGASVFTKQGDEPNEAAVAEHFDKYKGRFAGEIDEQNPYGFGYKLEDQVQLEYIALKLEDVASIVERPSDEEVGRFFVVNREQMFTEQVPMDPNDPNSVLIRRPKDLAEVEDQIFEMLLRQRIDRKAEQILQEAKDLTDRKIEDALIAAEKELEADRLKELAGNYLDAARQVSEKYKVPLHTGTTGYLSAVDLQADADLSRLYILAGGQSPIGIGQIVFTVQQLDGESASPLFVGRTRMFESIGPARDQLGLYSRDMAGQIMALIRVVDARGAGEPESVDVTFSTEGLSLSAEPEENGDGEDFSVRKNIIENMKRLAAMPVAKAKAEELLELVKSDGWEGAIKKFNALYGEQAKKDPNDPNTFQLVTEPTLQRISRDRLEMFAVHNMGNPMARPAMAQANIQKQFVDRLYGLVPEGADRAAVPATMEFKPSMGWYCLRDVSVQRISQSDYSRMKLRRAQRGEYTEAQALAAVHFDPQNIVSRMAFEAVESKDDRDESKQADSREAS